jgi:hypothetical protein
LQDAPETLVVLAEMPAGSVKVSFFGGIGFGRINDPLRRLRSKQGYRAHPGLSARCQRV